MKKELQKRLSQYTAAAAALTVGATGANAQIVYTDVAPDYTHPGDEVGIGLDMNNDTNFDFAIFSGDSVYVNSAGSFRVRNTVVAPYGSVASMNAIAGEAPSGYNYALALNMNDMIDNTLNWISTTNTMAYNVNSANPYNENWNGVTDKYVALRFSSGGSDYYGWARMDVQAIGDSWTIKDYAYNSTAATGINAGDMGTADVNEYTLDNLVHFINQTNNTVLVKVNGDLEGGLVNVISMTGQTVSTGAVVNGTYTVDMNGLQAGIYMINVTFGKETISRKMTVR